MTVSARTLATRTLGAAVAVALAVPAGLITAGSASAAPATLSISDVQPVNPANSAGLVVQRVAPPLNTGNASWMLNMDFFLRNTASTSLGVNSVTVSFPGTSIATKTYSIARTLSGKGSSFVILPEDRLFPFPVAPKVNIKVNAAKGDPVSFERPLAEYVNKTPSGGYQFPTAQTADGFWRANPANDSLSHHRGVQNQRFAYDLLLVKWDSTKKAYSHLKPGFDGTQNVHYWTFGQPVYAMADGIVRKCRIGLTDNVPPNKAPKPEVEGNHVYVEHATGEHVLYAHFKASSIPSSVCSSTGSGKSTAVKKGQLLGLAGNTGNSTAPHIHLHLARNFGFTNSDGSAAQGLPLRFNHARVRMLAGLTNTNTNTFATLTNSSEGTLIKDYVIDPSACGFHRIASAQAEWARHGVKPSCYQEEFNDLTLAGYRPIWYQNGPGGIASIWRPKGSTPFIQLTNLTASAFQSAFNTHTGNGYRVTHLESFVEAGAVKYAATFTKQSGPAFRVYHGVSQATHQSNFNTFVSQGYRPTQISVVNLNGTRSFSAVYELTDVGSFTAFQAVSESELQTVFNQQTSAGRRPVYADAWMDGTTPRFSLIFTSKASTNYVLKAGMTHAQYQTDYNAQRSAGRLTQNVSSYTSGGVTKYIALWRA